LDKKHKLIKGAIYLFLGKIFNLLIGSLQFLLIPRLLGPQNMGFYSYWLSVYFIVGRILGLGGQHIIIKYVPELRMRNKFMIPSLVKKIVIMKFPLFLVIICWGLLFRTNELTYFMIAVSASLLFSLNLVGESILYSHHWMGTYALIPLLRQALRITLVIVFFYLFYTSGIVLGIFGAPLIAFLLSLFLALRLLPRKQMTLDQPFRKYFSFGFWIYISEAIYGMIIWLIVILSRIYIEDMEIVGYLGVGVQICFSVTLLTFFINESILPSLVEFRVLDDRKFKDSLKLAWKYTNIILFPLIFGGYVLAKPFIAHIIGKDYVSGTLIIKLFFPAILFLSWIRFHIQILFVYEKKIMIFLTQLINLIVFLGSWFYLVKSEHIHFAPLSLILGTMTAYVFILVSSNKIEKVEHYVVHLLKPLTAAALMALVVNFLKIQSLIQLFLVVLLGFFIYALCLFLFKGIGTDDIKIFKEFVTSIRPSQVNTDQ